MPTPWIVPSTDAGARLDVFLTREMPGTTRSQIAKRIKAGDVMVNGKPATVHRFLKTGDVVQMASAPPQIIREDTLQESTQEKTRASPQKVEILAETPDWIVINKPSGLLVHPDGKTRHGTLVDFLMAHDPNIARVGEDLSRPGIVHRLDKEVSGLMIVAKTQDAFDDLKRQFAEHTVDKRYLALVSGRLEKDEGDITFKIARSKTKQRMAARPEQEEEGKAAWTHYQVLRRARDATLLELTILTGRTHQIRAHLLALNHPILGDMLYGRTPKHRRGKSTRDLATGTRLLLQATHLGFRDPTTGEKREFQLPPLPEFDTLIPKEP